jgi:2-keto-3-deoxy-6-phosphogluconate aldolase
VDLSNAKAYLEAGAAAIGVGASIFPAEAINNRSVEMVHTLAAELMRSIR